MTTTSITFVLFAVSFASAACSTAEPTSVDARLDLSPDASVPDTAVPDATPVMPDAAPEKPCAIVPLSESMTSNLSKLAFAAIPEPAGRYLLFGKESDGAQVIRLFAPDGTIAPPSTGAFIPHVEHANAQVKFLIGTQRGDFVVSVGDGMGSTWLMRLDADGVMMDDPWQVPYNWVPDHGASADVGEVVSTATTMEGEATYFFGQVETNASVPVYRSYAIPDGSCVKSGTSALVGTTVGVAVTYFKNNKAHISVFLDELDALPEDAPVEVELDTSLPPTYTGMECDRYFQVVDILPVSDKFVVLWKMSSLPEQLHASVISVDGVPTTTRSLPDAVDLIKTGGGYAVVLRNSIFQVGVRFLDDDWVQVGANYWFAATRNPQTYPNGQPVIVRIGANHFAIAMINSGNAGEVHFFGCSP